MKYSGDILMTGPTFTFALLQSSAKFGIFNFNHCTFPKFLELCTETCPMDDGRQMVPSLHQTCCVRSTIIFTGAEFSERINLDKI